MIGSIHPLATAVVPFGWLECDGTTYARTDYPALYAALHPGFIVDADFFVVPDLRQRTVFGADDVNGPLMTLTGGSSEVTLDISELPVHSHPGVPHDHTSPPHSHTSPGHTHNESGVLEALATVGEGVPTSGGQPIPATTGATAVTIDATEVTIDLTAAPTDNAGGGAPHDNMPPYMALRWGIIAL